MITFTLQGERLFQIRFIQPITNEDVKGLIENAMLGTLLPIKTIVCVDLMHAKVLPSHLIEPIIGMMKQLKDYVDRMAFLLPANGAVIRLQVERMIREAKSPARRAFTSAQEMLGWFSEIATEEENVQLQAFLEEAPSLSEAR